MAAALTGREICVVLLFLCFNEGEPFCDGVCNLSLSEFNPISGAMVSKCLVDPGLSLFMGTVWLLAHFCHFHCLAALDGCPKCLSNAIRAAG